MKKQASKICNRLSKLLNLFIQQQVIKIYAWKNKAKCLRPITVLKLLTPANNSQETSKMLPPECDTKSPYSSRT